MIIQFHRGLSTGRSWIPPKITVSKVSDSKDSSIQRIIHFYSQLPQGPFISPPSTSFFSKYKAKFFDNSGRRQPIFHFIVGLVFIGYFLGYHKHSCQD
ncbi:hypothetical protein PCK1_001184 [Pneumocystis canis]|nr:hypothetical protein PCK1_001184 [Pneumocystis canis]